MLKRLLHWWRSIRFFRYYIIADPADNSITFSRSLYRHIERHSRCDDRAAVFVFRVSAWNTFGFVINPDLPGHNTQLADIQYNAKFRSIGFESLCPTVSRIFYDYGLPVDRKMKLTVTVRRHDSGKVFYNIERPHI